MIILARVLNDVVSGMIVKLGSPPITPLADKFGLLWHVGFVGYVKLCVLLYITTCRKSALFSSSTSEYIEKNYKSSNPTCWNKFIYGEFNNNMNKKLDFSALLWDIFPNWQAYQSTYHRKAIYVGFTMQYSTHAIFVLTSTAHCWSVQGFSNLYHKMFTFFATPVTQWQLRRVNSIR